MPSTARRLKSCFCLTDEIFAARSVPCDRMAFLFAAMKRATVRRVKERKIYRYINGEKIHHTISPKLGERCRTDKSIYYTLDFNVTPHLLRHTYITNLIHEGVDPKTVQYLAGHENSKVTMDIYAKVKYNKPWELAAVVNEAFQPSTEYRENPAS